MDAPVKCAFLLTLYAMGQTLALSHSDLWGSLVGATKKGGWELQEDHAPPGFINSVLYAGQILNHRILPEPDRGSGLGFGALSFCTKPSRTFGLNRKHQQVAIYQALSNMASNLHSNPVRLLYLIIFLRKRKLGLREVR